MLAETNVAPTSGRTIPKESLWPAHRPRYGSSSHCRLYAHQVFGSSGLYKTHFGSERGCILAEEVRVDKTATIVNALAFFVCCVMLEGEGAKDYVIQMIGGTDSIRCQHGNEHVKAKLKVN